MDKLSSGYFNHQNHTTFSLNLGFQPKLFVNVPKQTNIKGEYSIKVYEYLITYLSKFIVKLTKFKNL